MADWSLEEPHRRLLRLGSIVVSFQLSRAARGAESGPLNLGALTLGQSSAGGDDHVVIALRDDDGFWIGVEPADRQAVAVRVIVESPQEVDAVTGESPLPRLSYDPPNYVTVPAEYAISGVRHRGAFTRRNAMRLRLVAIPSVDARGRKWDEEHAAVAIVRIVSPDVYERLVGERAPEPLDESDAYRGWRLP